jgi:thiamine-phosphate pyrophosphorylase
MLLSFQGYYAILDVKGSSVDLSASLCHVGKLLAAKPCCLQLRGKYLGVASLCELGHALRPLCTQHQVPLCINDRLDVALAVQADVIHVGQNDLPLAEIVRLRTLVKFSHLRIGISTHDLDEALAAAECGADYIGFGPVFSTQSKADADPAVGLDALRVVTSAVQLPVIAIGGVTLDNVDAVVQAGADGAAAIAAVDLAANPTLVGQHITQAFRNVRPRAIPLPPVQT